MIYNKDNLKGKLIGFVEEKPSEHLRVIEIDDEAFTVTLYACDKNGEILVADREFQELTISPYAIDIKDETGTRIVWWCQRKGGIAHRIKGPHPKENEGDK